LPHCDHASGPASYDLNSLNRRGSERRLNGTLNALEVNEGPFGYAQSFATCAPVMYEVANESSGQAADSVVFPDGSSVETPIGDTTQWQYWVINTVKGYERAMGYDPHPIGMTYLYPVAELGRSNEPLWNSPADWISPGFDDTLGESRWLIDPPPNDGSKVVLLDTDHFSPFSSDALWVGRHSFAGIIRSCTTWGSSAAACRRTRRRGPLPSTHWSQPVMRWETPVV
jgi:hypothetical protein